MSGGRIGMLGGTFDPIHIGHLIVAQDVVEALGLDRLLVVPAARPPHREAQAPAGVRFRLTRRAFAGDDRFEVSDLELRRSGPSYTVDTLREIRDRRSPDELFCVIGLDQLRELDSWREPGRIVELARLAVMSRGGETACPEDHPSAPDFRPVEVTRVEISGSRLRDRLARGLGVQYLVPESIRREVEREWAPSKRAAPPLSDAPR